MTDQRKDDLPDNGGTPEERPGGKRPRRHWGRAVLRGIGVLLVLAVVMSLVVVSTMSNGRYKDRFRRWLIYGSSEEENLYSYSADSNNLFAQLGDYLVLANQNHLQLLRSDGTAQQDISVQLSHPALSTGGGLAAAWDVGGTALTVADKDGVLFQRDQEEKLISVRLNQAGWLAVTEEKSGYKGTVTVYNQEQEKVFAFNSSSRFLLDAVVSRDGRRLLAVTMSQEGGAFVSNLVLYDLSQTEPLTEGKVQEGLVLDLWDSDDGYRAVCDDMLAFADKNAQLTGTYSYGAFYLQDYSMSGGTFTALLLGRYRAGSVGQLITVDESGGTLGELDVTREVLDISAAGDYLAVLYSDELVIYHSDLTVYASTAETELAGQVIMAEDGSALVMAADFAWRFLP